MGRELIADTGGLLRALAYKSDGTPSWPSFQAALTRAKAIVVPALILAEVDYFLRDERAAMRTLVAEIFDPATTYEFEPTTARDFVRALHIDAKFKDQNVGLVDCVVATVAERRRIHRVLTTDIRHFSVLRIGANYRTALQVAPQAAGHTVSGQ